MSRVFMLAFIIVGAFASITYVPMRSQEIKTSTEGRLANRTSQNEAAGLFGTFPAVRIRESKPTIVKDAEFVAISEVEWKHRGSDGYQEVVDVQLRITNRGRAEQAFLTFDTIGLILKHGDGTEVKHTAERNDRKLTRPIFIEAGGSYALCLQARLGRDASGKSASLVFYDGTGTKTKFGPMAPGAYHLVLRYETTRELAKLEHLQGVPIWVGKVLTRDVSFDLLAP